MERLGAVLTFKSHVSKEEAVKALEKIADLIDLPDKSYEIIEKDGRNSYEACPFKIEHKVNKFDDEYGGPVWYIP